MRKTYLWMVVPFIIMVTGCAGLNRFLGSKQAGLQVKQRTFHPIAVQHFIRGSINELRGNYESALLEFSEALLYDSSSVTIYNKIAEQYIRLQKVESAKKMLLTAEKRFPDNIETHQILASIYLSKRQITKAEQEFQK